jgi:RNA polymerase sigma factor (sigma-70 family)
MRPQNQDEDFVHYQQLLWGVLSTLSRRGYFVPPDDARDVLHDFYVEAWRGVNDRFDPAKASFRTYVANSFYLFARRRLVQMNHWRRLVVDLEVDEATQRPSDEAEPEDRLELEQRLSSLESIVQKLPDFDQKLLCEYLTSDRASERRIAEAHALTRYQTRKILASAVGRIALLLQQTDGSSQEAKIATQLWLEGRSAKEAAHFLGLSIDIVQKQRSRLASSFLASIRTFNSRSVIAGAVMSNKTSERLKSILLSDQGLDALAAEADHIRKHPDAIDDIDFTKSELDRLRQRPETLALLYQLLASDEDEASEPSEIELMLQQAQSEEGQEIGEAFQLMVENLPSDLVRWEKWFDDIEVDREYRQYLSAHPSVRYGGAIAQRLVRFGITPATIAGAARGLQLLFDRALRGDEPPSNYPKDDSLDHNWFTISNSTRRTEVSRDLVVSQISTTPWLPNGSKATIRFTEWLFALLRVRPFLVYGYQFQITDESRAAFVEHLSGHSQRDLAALWTREDTATATRLRQMHME